MAANNAMSGSETFRGWKKLTSRTKVGGPLPLRFEVRDDGDCLWIDGHMDTTDVSDFRPITVTFSRAVERHKHPSYQWLLDFARWIYQHELDEWWTVSGGRPRVPHDKLGNVKP